MLEKTLESPLDNQESKPINPKQISSEYSLEGLMLQLKLQYFGYLMQKADLLESQRIKLNLVTEQQQEINSAFFLFSGLSFHFVDGFLCFAKAFKFN